MMIGVRQQHLQQHQRQLQQLPMGFMLSSREVLLGRRRHMATCLQSIPSASSDPSAMIVGEVTMFRSFVGSWDTPMETPMQIRTGVRFQRSLPWMTSGATGTRCISRIAVIALQTTVPAVRELESTVTNRQIIFMRIKYK